MARSLQRGTLLMIAAILLLGIAGLAFALSFAAAGSAAQRAHVTERALAQAREALMAYAADRANDGGAVAVVFAPGAPLTRLNADGTAASEQRRDCAPGDCDLLGRCATEPPQRAARCDPRNYLDNAPAAGFAGEDNADF